MLLVMVMLTVCLSFDLSLVVKGLLEFGARHDIRVANGWQAVQYEQVTFGRYSTKLSKLLWKSKLVPHIVFL
jgi:hypothetical protein